MLIARVALILPLAACLRAQPGGIRDVEVYGQKISYQEAGSGPEVILLHGLGGDRSAWAFTVPALAKKFHVYAPDQVGFGDSDKPLIDYRISTLVEFLDAFCKKLNIQKATLVGNSLGGWVALDFALKHPDRVNKLMLVDSAGYSPKRVGGPVYTREQLHALDPATVEEEKRLMSMIFHNPQFSSEQFAERAFTAHLKKGDGFTIARFLDSITHNEDILDGRLGAIQAPTLVVWGREDALVPLAYGKAFAEDIHGAQSVTLDNCGHVPQMECAAPFEAAVLKFLE